jgi:beta-lactamase superfamily II metal-dependent hydrolase
MNEGGTMDIAVYCLNVGQASCAAVIDPLPAGEEDQFQASLIDVGVEGGRLADWLESVGVQRIPLIAITHNDDDHVCGLPELVWRFRRRIGRLLFVIDRDPAGHPPIPFYADAQRWVARGSIVAMERLETPQEFRPGLGHRLIQEPEASYRLYCAFPTMQQTEAVVHRATLLGRETPRVNPNATSGVLRLTRTVNPRRTRVLFGGDLDYRGWQWMVQDGLDLRTDVLVAPHHGAPWGATTRFGARELADATSPRYVLFSVGTRQPFPASGRHPHPDVVREFRSRSATVLCTQITRRCHDTPETIDGRSVIPLASLTRPHDLSPSGAACAGTILVTLRESGHIAVARVRDHQAAVNQLQTTGEHPICRP